MLAAGMYYVYIYTYISDKRTPYLHVFNLMFNNLKKKIQGYFFLFILFYPAYKTELQVKLRQF